MSGFTGLLAPILLSPIPAAATAPLPAGQLSGVALWLVAAGLLGMGLRDIIGGDDEPDEADLEDDDFLGGLDADGSMDEDFDGFDDPLDGGDDDPLAEVEPRLDDLEAELADLASTVSAVRGEHESIRESVEGVEENVRKLLEVYEVVTQGANPFADAPPQAAGGGAFGLFEAGEEPSAAGAPGESVDGLFESDQSSESAAVEAETGDAVEPEAAQGNPDDDRPDGEPGGDDGLSFEDLKSEFEYVGEEDGGAEPTNDAPEPEVPTPEEADRPAGPAPAEDPFEPGPERSGSAADGPTRRDDGSAKPYLRALPDGFGAELLVMEWLEFLVSSSSVADAIRAVRYYESVEWIADDVAAHLQTVLSGTNPGRDRAATDGGLPGQLGVDHHTRSLEYITRIDELAGEPARHRPPADTRADRGARRGDRGVQR